MEYLNKLKQLAAGEAICACQYYFAYKNMRGDNSFNYLSEHFEAHADEEWEHYSILIDELMKRGNEGYSSMADTLKNAIPELAEIPAYDTDSLKQFFIDSEEAAVEAYEEYYDEIKDEADLQDLADIILDIIKDEKEHKLDFEKLDPVKLVVQEESTKRAWLSCKVMHENIWRDKSFKAYKEAQKSLDKFGKIYVDVQTEEPVDAEYAEVFRQKFGEPR